MFCNTYHKSLTEAAAAGRELPPALQQHLSACESCNAAFAEERSLFAAIDAGLRSSSNSEVPATLIPRVHVALNNEPVAQSHSQKWIFVGAALASVLVVVLIVRFNWGQPPFQQPTDVAQKASAKPAIPGNVKAQYATKASAPPSLRHSPDAVSSNSQSRVFRKSANNSIHGDLPEVLVAPGQEEAIAQLMGAVRQGKINTDTLLAKSEEPHIDMLSIAPLELTPVEMKPIGNSREDLN